MYYGLIKKEEIIQERTHCCYCGSLLEIKQIEGRLRKICSVCGAVNYLNPTPSVAAVITDGDGGLLLTRRSVEPGKGLWCLPGGFIEMGETPPDTLVREVEEETGLKIAPETIIDACSKLGGYYGDVLILGYTASILGGELAPGDDADEVKFFPLEQLPPIAFRCHSYFIECALSLKLPPAPI